MADQPLNPIPLSVTVDADAINAAVASAIAQSAVGEMMKASIDRSIAALAKSWDNPYDKIMEQFIRQEAAKIIREEYGEAVREAIRKRMTPEVLEEMTTKAFNSYISGG